MRKAGSGSVLSETDLEYTVRTCNWFKPSYKGKVSAPTPSTRSYKTDRKECGWGTGEGLVCFPSTDALTYKTYQRKDGLLNTNICAITEDKKGNIWFSNNKGISCYVTDKTASTITVIRTMSGRQFSSGCVTQNQERTDLFRFNQRSMLFRSGYTMNDQANRRLSSPKWKYWDGWAISKIWPVHQCIQRRTGWTDPCTK